MRYKVEYHDYSYWGWQYVISEYNNPDNIIKRGICDKVSLKDYDCKSVKEYILSYQMDDC